MITTAHGPSAANNNYWPEMYTNQPIVNAGRKHQYSDSPQPRVFGNASPFDPQLFSTVNACAGELLKGESSGKYSPLEVAQWLEDLAAGAANSLNDAKDRIGDKNGVEFRRWSVDIGIQSGLGRFFGAKLRAGVLYGLHERTGSRAALEAALREYRRARELWLQMAKLAQGVYAADVTVGEHAWLRGHWMDRLGAIDEDIADMEKRREVTRDGGVSSELLDRVMERPERAPVRCRHVVPATFRAGQPMEVACSLPGSGETSVRLYYRHVNQAERFQIADMQRAGDQYRGSIPGAYTSSPFPLQYYFEIRLTAGKTTLYPGFAPDRMNQPYFVVQRAG
jgi:hypothetical protein